MNKILILGAIVAILGLAMTGFAFAQSTTPPQPEYPEGYYGPGRMGMWGGRGVGMLEGGLQAGGRSSGDANGLMHNQMIAALAEIFGLSVEDLEARHEAGETMWSLAEQQGFTFEQFRDMMLQARNQAISQAAADGVISQEKSNWMIQRMDQMWSGENNPGFQGCYGTGSQGFGRHSGWMHWGNTR